MQSAFPSKYAASDCRHLLSNENLLWPELMELEEPGEEEEEEEDGIGAFVVNHCCKIW